jgi:segregation and condensation protein A
MSELGDLPNQSILISKADTSSSAVIANVVAKLYGEPLFNFPNDLYIPPAALEIFLDAFEGPLDLLLYLIRKQNFDILDIPMLSVTRQYLSYVEQIKNINLELAAEYLLMAAMLIEIKSRMLLPSKKIELNTEDDPRVELVRRLLEYEKFKLAALKLANQSLVDRDFFIADAMMNADRDKIFPHVCVNDLKTAWQNILRLVTVNKKHFIDDEELSVREVMIQILKRLQGHKFVEFGSFFEVDKGRSFVVISFIALLELAKESFIELTQAQSFAPIYIRLTATIS